MIAADVGNDRLIHLVAANADGTRIDDAAQREHGDLGRAATDINHHRTGRFGHWQVGPDRGGHRFLDQKDLTRPGGFGGFHDRAAFHFR